MGALGVSRQSENTFIIESEGVDTLVNGVTIKAFWQNAGIVAIQRFIAEQDWALEAFELRLPAYATKSPYNMKNASEVVRSDTGWRGVVRNLNVESNDNEVIQVNCLVVLTTE